jgi:hypothetical protein
MLKRMVVTAVCSLALLAGTMAVAPPAAAKTALQRKHEAKGKAAKAKSKAKSAARKAKKKR